jgi:hypothetical protein
LWIVFGCVPDFEIQVDSLKDQEVKLKLLENFNEVLVGLPPEKLKFYLKLCERIVTEPRIPPNVLGLLLQCMNNEIINVIFVGYFGSC